MKELLCPVNGLRPITEFVYGGPVRTAPPADCGDDAWADYVWQRDGAAGVQHEWWCHLPSTTWFIAVRDTATDQVIRTYLPEAAP